MGDATTEEGMEFTDALRSLPLIFATSSQRKFDHVSYLADRNQIEIYQYPFADYPEIQEDNMERMFNLAIKNSNSLDELSDMFYIIEDTWVYLEAYGKESRGPGNNFKKWWSSKSKEEREKELSIADGAEVISGMAFHIPGNDPLIFSNRQTGRVHLNGKIRSGNEEYSWLSQDDFNLYFVPDGASKVYNEMDIIEFLKYDFRRPNFVKVADRVNQYTNFLRKGLSYEDLNEELDSLKTSYNIESGKEIRQARLDSNF